MCTPNAWRGQTAQKGALAVITETCNQGCFCVRQRYARPNTQSIFRPRGRRRRRARCSTAVFSTRTRCGIPAVGTHDSLHPSGRRLVGSNKGFDSPSRRLLALLLRVERVSLRTKPTHAGDTSISHARPAGRTHTEVPSAVQQYSLVDVCTHTLLESTKSTPAHDFVVTSHAKHSDIHFYVVV